MAFSNGHRGTKKAYGLSVSVRVNAQSSGSTAPKHRVAASGLMRDTGLMLSFFL
jgi:hypothetical protein